MAKCIIECCDNIIKPRSRLTICATCRSSLYNWRRRKVGEVIARRQRLHKYDDRMRTIVSDDTMEKKSKMVHISSARRARRAG